MYLEIVVSFYPSDTKMLNKQVKIAVDGGNSKISSNVRILPIKSQLDSDYPFVK